MRVSAGIKKAVLTSWPCLLAVDYDGDLDVLVEVDREVRGRKHALLDVLGVEGGDFKRCLRRGNGP